MKDAKLLYKRSISFLIMPKQSLKNTVVFFCKFVKPLVKGRITCLKPKALHTKSNTIFTKHFDLTVFLKKISLAKKMSTFCQFLKYSYNLWIINYK